MIRLIVSNIIFISACFLRVEDKKVPLKNIRIIIFSTWDKSKNINSQTERVDKRCDALIVMGKMYPWAQSSQFFQQNHIQPACAILPPLSIIYSEGYIKWPKTCKLWKNYWNIFDIRYMEIVLLIKNCLYGKCETNSI